jgi:hypothetical protein
MTTRLHPPARRRGVALRVLLAAGLPLAVLGLVSRANEYESWGGSGVDCDGPFLLVFAWPAAVVYAVGALVFVRRSIRRFRWGSAVAALACVLLAAGLAANIRAAYRELNGPDHRLVCEAR